MRYLFGQNNNSNLFYFSSQVLIGFKIQKYAYAPFRDLTPKRWREIAQTEALNPVEKASVEVPIKIIETELQKPQPNKTSIDQAVALLKKGLESVETLAEPVMKVAAILAKVWMPM
ncbi:hypothetical protein ACL6C3_15220 [Capilliphycus salinus ALCB114379]|uniref:hypothetical protein n=1 Tax=Capilliphycus salinus TaxID=2768948 RepID=UPI0039A59843